MKNALLCACLLIFAFCSSCRKEHLFGERKALIGNWQWDATFHQYTCFPQDTEWITPATWDTTYSIEITPKEKIYFLKDGEIQDEYSVAVSYFTDSRLLNNGFLFNIYFEDNGTLFISGNVNSDSLVLQEYWPDPFIDESCHDYTHYFVKEED